jgi:hypothetical protein
LPIGGNLSGWNLALVQDQVAIATRNALRRGYYQYHYGWRDNFFCYPYYSFQPIYGQSFFSPWYGYAHLPGYLSYDRCSILDNIVPIVIGGLVYNWSRPNYGYYGNSGQGNSGYGSRRYSQIDYAVGDIVDAFEYRDPRSLERVIGRNSVNVFFDTRYAYTLKSVDFYDLMLDLVTSTETTSYTVERIYRDNNRVNFIARHDYNDPWGRPLTQYHTYVLRDDRRGPYITDFGVTDDPQLGFNRRLGR